MRKGLGILSMQASLTLPEIVEARREEIVALFSAEHGFFGSVAAGEKTGDQIHPYYKLPIRSLYGAHKRPTDEMMADISEMIIDLCDIGVRCYTYLATMKLMLEVCAEKGIPVTVIDHPIPLHGKVDGPRREEKWSCFVSPIDVPLLHGMTPGEAAKFIAASPECKAKSLKLKVIDDHLHSTFCTPTSALWNFVPPSPAIRSVDSAALYPMLVWSEAYPAVDIDRNGPLAFRMISAPFVDVKNLVKECNAALPKFGVKALHYGAGVLFSISDFEAFKPVSAGVKLLEILLKAYPEEMMVGFRREWMAKLYGTEKVQAAVESGTAEEEIKRWQDTYSY